MGEIVFQRGGTNGQIVFEIGSALADIPEWRQTSGSKTNVSVGNKCVQFFQECCGEAKRTILCWLWLARSEGIAKDVRLLIADLVWEDRAAWSRGRASC
jgi:hypothetical protein